MNTVAIIIARGGSRRLLRKNVLPFCGKPLVEWSIIQARCTRCLSDEDIYISTDDDEIAEVAWRNKVNVILRPDWPNPDKLSAMPVFMHAIATIRAVRPITHVFSILPSCPVRNPGDFDAVRSAYMERKATDGACREMLMFTPRLESIVWRKRGSRTEISIFDKEAGYLGPGPSVEIKEISWWDEWGWSMRLDGEESNTEDGLTFRNRPIYWMLGKWYQAFDIDDKDSFSLNEVLFDHYVLQGRGDSIYWEYKDGGGGNGRMDRRIEETAQRRADG